jgi:hypothetical protein
MLVQWGKPQFRTYFVWGGYSGIDNEDQAREATRKFQAPNAAYFWMPVPALSPDLISVLKLGVGRIPFDLYLLYAKGILWQDHVPVPTYWQQQIGVIQADPFNITQMERMIQREIAK